MKVIASRLIASAILASVALSACSKDGDGKKDGDKPTTPSKEAPGGDEGGGGGGNTGNTGGGNTGGGELGNTAVATKVVLSVGLVDAGTPVQTNPTYPDVAPIFNQNCVNCHKPGFVSPNLETFPFTAVGGDSLAMIVDKISARINHTTAPMPPQGMMAPALRAQVDAWIAAGYPAAPTTRPGLSLEGYKVRWRLREAGATAWSNWQEVAASAATELTLGKRLVGSVVDAEVEIVGPRGGVMARKDLGTLTVPPAGALSASLVASAEDQSAPAPGDRGNLTLTTIAGDGGYVVTWAPAADDVTPASALEYRLYVATGDVIRTADEVQGNGTALGEFSPALTRVVLTGTPVAAPMFVNVLVRDAAGNVAAYGARLAESAPRVPVTEALVVSSVTDRSLILTWQPAVDDDTPADELRYRVVSANGQPLQTLADMDGKVIVRDFTAGSTTLVVQGLIPQTSYTFNVQVQDRNGNTVAYAPVNASTLATPSNDPDYDINTYGKECAARLGELPAFNCLDGEIIPITVGGHVPAEGYPAFGPGGDRDQDCDKPALLGLGSDGRCPPYARLGRLKSFSPDGDERTDVETVFICRRYKGRFGPQTHRGETMDASVFPAFEDVAIIQHNKTTGETCWFQMLSQGSPKDARRVPPPTEVQLPADAPAHALSAKDFWLPPASTAGIGCISCHDSDPWIHTPYVDQVRLADGKPLVPENVFGPYKMIGRRHFNEWLSPSRRSFAVNTASGDNACTSCHRIGSRNTCSSFVRESAGLRRSASLSDFADTEYALRYWMPPEGTENRPADLTAWHNNEGGYKEAVDRLLACCNDPSSPACSRTPINDVPPPFAD